jgi:hypothetical protein
LKIRPIVGRLERVVVASSKKSVCWALPSDPRGIWKGKG